MKHLTEKPFKANDVRQLFDNMTENIRNKPIDLCLDMLEKLNLSRTWWFESEVVGCGGIFNYPNGDCEAWSVVNKKLAKKFKRELLVGAKRFLNGMAETYGIKKMRATWRIDFDPNIKWLEHLGFTKTDRKAKLNDFDEAYIYERQF